MLPTAVSQLIEQVGRVAIALPFAYLGMRQGGVALGAAGALLGGTIAEGAALLYMLLFVISVSYLAMGAHNPFIYFTF